MWILICTLVAFVLGAIATTYITIVHRTRVRQEYVKLQIHREKVAFSKARADLSRSRMELRNCVKNQCNGK